ncbi:amino acid adenylation domain-containing protein [Archangium lansingense]|uniref:amino acid adenylation domain-containing protein n=1 Tax=Archangium lansingense TaxID=2995310 RepID=UPI003B76C0C8
MSMKNVEDIYRLSPMQQGMLFHVLQSPGTGTYVEQVYWMWRGPLDTEQLRRAWQKTVERNTALRTAFFWEGMPEPLQAVRRKVELGCQELDWRDVPTSEQEARFTELLEKDQLQGFNLSAAPLVRLCVVRVTSEQYRCLLTYHHLVMDGWSVPLCLREAFLHYDAALRGSEAKLEPARLYRDYIAWLAKQDRAEAERYWKQALRGFTAPTPLRVERASTRTTPGAERYGGETLRLPESLGMKLSALTRQHQLTLSTLIQGAWALLLGHYSGNVDVAFGTVVSGRPPALPGVDTMLGTFINTLVSRVKLPSQSQVLPWLKQLQAEQLDARRFEYLSLVEVQGCSEVPRGQPLFHSLVVVENLPRRGLPAEMTGRLPVEGFTRTEGRTGYPLTVVVLPDVELEVQCLYDSERFDAVSIRRMLEHFGTLLCALVETPERRLGELSLLAPEEERRLLAEWSGVRDNAPSGACLMPLFEEQVHRTPEAVALTYEGTRLTYRELDSRANQLAWHLRSLGIGPEVLAALYLERSPELVVAMLGVLKAGGAYVPIDPSVPQERVALLLRDAAPRVVLTQQSLQARLPSSPVPALCLDSGWEEVARHPSQAPAPLATPDNLAYVIFTSGSTGTPKGVMVPHRGVPNLAFAQARAFGVHADSRVLQFASPAFDATVSEVFVTLLAGATLSLAPRDSLLPGPSLVELLKQQAITTATLPPTVLAMLPAGELGSLTTVISAGETCPPEVVARWATGSRRFINAYGPTETTVCATLTECSANGQPPPIGRPLANTRAYVLDGSLRPVPTGVPGELYVGGLGIARGYLNRPELTAERFLPDPFGPSGTRMYRTGDQVRWRADGQLEFLGRVDFQVKVRGFRIEPGEIEAVLAQHPSVRQSVVLAREDKPGDKQLVAYVVPISPLPPGEGRGEGISSPGLNLADLRAFLQRKLPEYLVPTAFVPMETLPLNTSGKVDRKALPAPEGANLARRPYIAPGDDVERKLAELWSKLLGVEKVGAEDHFFELGGHSLLATQVASRIRATFGVELPLRAVFEAPTLSALATRIRAASGSSTPPLRPAPRNGPQPLSFAQQRLWFLHELHPTSAAYNLPAALRLEGELDAEALRLSFEHLVRRHESLRTTFSPNQGDTLQVIHPASRWALPVMDLSALPEGNRHAEALRLAEREALRPFDLTTGPLLRTTLLRLGEREHLLLVTQHHIVSDGWSIGVLVREVAALYEALRAGHEPRLPALPVQYADYAVWQRQWLKGEPLQEQVKWWKKHLAGAPHALELPTDRPRPPVQSSQGASLPVHLPPALTEPLRALCQHEGATPFMGLLATFQLLLSRHSGQEDVLVGTPIANRTQGETEPLIGFFVNTLAMRTRVRGHESFRSLLAQVRTSTLSAFEHQHLPFEKLVEELHPPRDLSRTPIVQVLFALQNAPASELRLPGLTLHTLPIESVSSKYDLELYLSEAPDGLRGSFVYNTDLFERTTVERLASHLQVLVEALTTQPDAPVSALPLLTATERRQVLVEWNGARASYPADALIHTLIEAQTRHTPEAVALRFEDSSLTYRELDARANQLAHHLRGLGVGPEVRVGVCLERSLELVVALLGTLKAGGAYVPLDPTFPPERLSWMFEDSRPAVLLVQERLLPALPANAARVVCVDSGWDEVARHSVQPPAPLATPDNLAYVIFTSGSTGRPKGAMNTHRAVCNRLLWMQDAYGLEPWDTVLQKTPFSFDVSVWEFFWPLMAGARLVVARPGGHQDPAWLVRTITDERVTTLHFVPSMLQAFLEEPDVGRCTSLRRVVCSGEALPKELEARCLQRLPGAGLHNLYGPTEAAVDVTFHECEPTDGKRSVPIGRPVANTSIRVLDVHLRPVPVGVSGELYIGGVQVGRGYLARPELTAERFIPDPFSDEPGARLYRTGDVARWLPDGELEYLGRNDFQVKVRGLRIELGEIESALERHEAVQQAVVLAREDIPGDKRLVAYVVPISTKPPAPPTSPLPPGEGRGEGAAVPSLDLTELRAILHQRLPEYMVPTALVSLESLPLTPSGKVDRKALPAPDGTHLQRGPYVAPRNETEQTLATLWAQVLHVDPVGVHDNFFSLGGDSLLGLRVVSLARQAGLDLTIRQLLQFQTVAGLAAAVGTLQQRGDEPLEPEGPLPLTPNQHISFATDDPERHIWTSSAFFEVDEPLDAELLAQAVRLLVARHDALRVRSVRESSGWRQHLAAIEAHAGCFVQVDLASTSDADLSTAIEAKANELQRSLDLTEGPLMRLALFDTGPARLRRLLLLVHHTVCDGYSLEVLWKELLTAYQQLRTGQSVQLPARTTSLRAYARKLEELARTEAVRREAPYWLDEERRHTLALPVDIPGGQHTGASARRLTVSLDVPRTQALLRAASVERGVQMTDLLLTALARTLARWTGHARSLVDLHDHGRDIVEDLDVSCTVGWLNFLFPVVLDAGQGLAPAESLRNTQQRLRAIPQRGLGHGLLRYLSGEPSLMEALKALPQPQLLFNYRGHFTGATTALPPGVRPARESAGIGYSLSVVRRHLLMVNAQIAHEALHVEWIYSEQVHRRDTVEALARSYFEELERLLP